MNGMKMTMKGLPLMAAAGAVLFSMAASATVDAAEVTVFRGGETILVDTNAAHKGPHVLRGGMGLKKPVKEPARVRYTANVTPIIAGSGDTVWFRTDDGLIACSLRGTGYVGGRRINCVSF